jgi:predicted nuclease of predicted toxin-antitoxin system
VKLLLDENLSKRIAREISDLFSVVSHVSELGLSRADDTRIWDKARDEALCIVSKDSDFLQRSVLFGAPPKVLFLKLGNCPTTQVVSVLRRNWEIIHAFCGDADSSLLILD